MFAIFALVCFILAFVFAVVGWRAPDRHFGWFAVAAIAAGLAFWLVQTGSGPF